MPAVMSPVRNIYCSEGTKKENPVHRRNRAKNGKVKMRSGRRPNVSMVKKAGRAKSQLRIPVPIDAKRAEVRLYPPCSKMVVE